MKRNTEKSDSKDVNRNAKKARIETEKEGSSGQPTESTSMGSSQSNVESVTDQETATGSQSEGTEEVTRKKKGRTSYVWQHFDIRFSNDLKTEYAHCKYCSDKKYKLSGRANGGTGNLNHHLKTKHPDKLPEKIPENEKFIFSQERYREALVKWIVVSGQPFCECEMESFLEMIDTLNPDAVTISKETVKRDIMKKFDLLVDEIKIKLRKSPSRFSFTLDAWTSKNFLPFLAIRAHWINDDWQYETVLLDFCYVEGKHDGENFSRMLLDCLKRYEVPLSKVLGVTIDNVSSNDTFMSFLEKHGIKSGVAFSSSGNRVRCMAHILNLCVQDILNSLKIPLNTIEDAFKHLDDEENEIDDEIEGDDTDEEDDDEITEDNEFTVVKLRQLIRKIRKSTQMRQKLRKLCELHNIKPLVPVIDVSTRWNSTYEMIERAFYLRAPLRNLCLSEKSLSRYLTTDGEWSDLNTLKKLLQKFDRSTNLMSMERHPAISSYLPTLNWLLESLQSFIDDNKGILAEAASRGLEKLQKYEQELQLSSSKLPYVAVFLNPSLKISYFKEHGYKKPLIKDIQKTICELFEATYGASAQSTNQTSTNSEEESSDEFFEFMHKRTANKEPKEFQKYLNFPLSAAKVNVLDYWRAHKDDFPNLSNMARDYLAVQSSSVAVERDFSSGADLVTPKRCSLLPQTIRACMCVKSWLKNLNL